MRSSGGTVTRAINVIEDITDLKQAELTQRLLAEAGRVLAGSLDYEETLRRVAWLAVPDLADWCMVDIFTDRGLERVAVACADPARSEHAHHMQGHPDRRDRGDRAGGRRPHRPRRAVPGGRRGPSAPHRAQPRAPRGDPRARRALGLQRAADAARRAPGRDDAVHDRLGPPARPRRARCARGARPPRRGRGGQRAAAPPAQRHRPDAAELAAAAGAAGDRGRRDGGAVPRGGRGHRRRRGLLRPLHRRPTTSGSRSWATCAARAPRRRR